MGLGSGGYIFSKDEDYPSQCNIGGIGLTSWRFSHSELKIFLLERFSDTRDLSSRFYINHITINPSL